MYVTLERTAGTTGTPLLLEYMGTDDAERGGEVAIIKPADVPTEGFEAVPMSFNGIEGFFLPNN